jgi:hypothetical protein
MKYLLLICADETIEVVADPVEPWVDDLGSRGIRLEGDRLRPTADATTVRDSGRLVTDGPFAETKEQIAGYDVIECADMAEAIQVAARHPVAKFGSIEVRPFWEE